jgi:DNA-binding beta-propeller fold protein YncE
MIMRWIDSMAKSMTLSHPIKKNPQKIKEYYIKRRKQKRIKIGISAIAGSVFVLIMLVFVLQPQLSIEEKYIFEKSWGILGKSNLEFDNPSGVAVDSKGNLYIADTGNNRIKKIQPDGNVTVIGNEGSELGEFLHPKGVAVDNKDNLYVADTENNRIQKIRPDGNITSIGKYGSNVGEFNHPIGVAVDNKDNLYVADTENNRIQKIRPDGNITSIGSFNLNEKISFYSKYFGPGEFFKPFGVAVDSKDNLYVADTENNRIQVFDTSLKFVQVIGSSGSQLEEFSAPSGVAVDSKDNLYVADTYNQKIQKFALSQIWVFEIKNWNK